MWSDSWKSLSKKVFLALWHIFQLFLLIYFMGLLLDFPYYLSRASEDPKTQQIIIGYCLIMFVVFLPDSPFIRTIIQRRRFKKNVGGLVDHLRQTVSNTPEELRKEVEKWIGEHAPFPYASRLSVQCGKASWAEGLDWVICNEKNDLCTDRRDDAVQGLEFWKKSQPDFENWTQVYPSTSE
jgi:hypothetical protein